MSEDQSEKSKSAQQSPPASKKMVDPLVAIMMNLETVKLSSTLVAKLEYIKYDETRRGVFRTAWAKDLFNTCVKRLPNSDIPSDFDIDLWYRSVISSATASASASSAPLNYWQDPKLQSQDINTNWLIPMFTMEIKVPGFITLLHNTIEMEDSAHSQLADKAKAEASYDFLGVGSRNAALRLVGSGTSGNHYLSSSSTSSQRPSYAHKLR